MRRNLPCAVFIVMFMRLIDTVGEGKNLDHGETKAFGETWQAQLSELVTLPLS